MTENRTDSADRPEPSKPAAFRPLRTKTVVDRIICRLLTAVINKDLVPGQRIPSEMELCGSMHVGRNSVREAIKVLVAMGMLTIRRSEGTFVSKGFSERMLNPMVYGLLLEDSDSATIVELYRVFEAGLLHVAAEKRTEEDIARLRESLARMEGVFAGSPDEAAVLEAVDDFQKTLSRALRNPLVNKINMMISGRMTLPVRSATVRRLLARGGLGTLSAHCRELLRVIAERDFPAAPQAIAHLFSLYAGA